MRNNPLASFATVAAVVSFGLLGWAIGCKGGDATTPSGAGPGDGTSCGADVSSDDHNCGACGHACDAHFYCKAGTCEAGCPDRVLYVSKSGDDHNYGCSRVAPRKTIAATIALARDIGARGHEIHVCQGTYTESGLSLDYPVSLGGAYDCVSWTRTSGYGMAGNFDGAHPTLLEHDGASGATLSIRGASVGADVTIDGLTIHGGNVDQGGG
ncbi:MAG TPA: hypothetical protein VNO21_01890, partial [Polyangiaceae bacterium]|nr:hypothetical protein [Polyangiaceae bacterium]